ncbi:MAG: DUF1963 domain-containing protein [Gemmatimonadetes bacterium]|nr:DUF1963 domain-containing protein [Gemmatimonadota bacterium]
MSDIEDRSLRQKLAAVRRRTWIPEVVDGDGGRADSKFSGRPYIPPSEAWPACGNCGKPMQLFVQLNGRDLPAEAGEALGGGLLQFFYCTSDDPHCESECEAYFPNATSTLLRLLVPGEATGADGAEPPAGMFPPRRIVGWTESPDYPNWEELDELGIELGDEEADALHEQDFPRDGEKLLGWPAWVQSVEYPACPECSGQMELLFQIDSEHNLPYMFGDVGTGHITQCPVHRHQLAFGWACG